MKARFELKAWLSENREVVIAKHEALTKEKFYNGITLRDFMVEVMNLMVINRVSDKKHAASTLTHVVGMVYLNNSKIEGFDKSQSALRKKYEGTAAMAMI